MEVIVHKPSARLDCDTLNNEVAFIQGEFIYSYLSKLNCSLEQKIEIADDIKVLISKKENT